MAMTIMAKNAQAYGLDEVAPLPSIEYDTIEVTAPTHLALVADLTGAPLPELMALNPALLKTVAPPDFSLHVPKGSAGAVTAALEMIPAARRASWRLHRVENGDTLASIGKRYGATPGNIAAANNLTSDEPVEGDQLVIPAAPVAQKTVAPARKSARGSAARRRAASASAKTAARARHSQKAIAAAASHRSPSARADN